MNQFEEVEDALRREIKEEAWIEVEIIKPISTYHIFRWEKNSENELIGIIFWCKTNTDVIKISDEHTDFKWVTTKEVFDFITKDSMQADIKAYLKEKNNTNQENNGKH
ncbi:MAG: hypothetical protein ACD_4C00292G0001 [uncultured bacterium (gcode 4)]|uniref:Nudix hydrolase domain-containing protein n=1 Tax=uncultured bacterium (gcode 4) TaxID=1234023 RepID=K2FU35_9BACT|nr:MAG: hypothetical protein ACD_4C00292G0001 [uncultured bacterium (gcode 4)]